MWWDSKNVDGFYVIKISAAFVEIYQSMAHKQETLDDSEAWIAARRYVDLMGKVPTSFQTTIRTLLVDQRATPPVISPASHFLVTRFLRGHTMKALFYYATLTYHGDEIANTPYLSSGQLVRLFTPGELAAMIAVIYAFRRIRQKASPQPWREICDHMTPEVDVGMHMGMAIPAIGGMVGVLTGAMPNLALGLFLLHDQGIFARYLEEVSPHERDAAEELEKELWGCTARHVACAMMQNFGLSVPVAHGLFLGLSPSPPRDDKEEPWGYAFAIAREWITSLREHGSPPERVHKGRYYPLQTAMHRLLYRVNRMRERGCEYRWLERTKDDISVEKTPQLFQEALFEAQNTGVLKDFYKKHLPGEILESLSEDDLSQIASGEEVEE